MSNRIAKTGAGVVEWITRQAPRPTDFGDSQMAGTLREALKTMLPPAVRNALQQWLQRALAGCGLNVAKAGDYYSPLPSIDSLRATKDRWCRPSAMRGVTYDVPAMTEYIAALLAKYRPELAALPSYEEITRQRFGPGYTETDALILYMMIREHKPARYVEVGSGVSTYYSSLAAAQNEKSGHPMQLTCIEPYPNKALASIPNVDLHSREVQDEDISTFAQLGPRDVLFIDSSHMLRIGADVPFLYLEVLPAIPSGVITHIHDVPFPYNFPYPAEFWIFGQTWPILWNEAMLLQAFLAFNREFEITLSLPLIRFHDEAFLRTNIPNYKDITEQPNTFSSIWLRRV